MERSNDVVYISQEFVDSNASTGRLNIIIDK